MSKAASTWVLAAFDGQDRPMRWWELIDEDDVLVPTEIPRAPLSLDTTMSPRVGPAVLTWMHALACDLTREYVETSLPELGSSVDFVESLRSSAEANLLGVLTVLVDPAAEVMPPVEALDYVHDAVLQRIPLTTVLHGYRRGMDHWLRWCAPAISRHAAPADRADELQLAIAAASRYIDRLSEIMVSEYEREMERRATSGAARRAAVVASLLGGDDVDIAEASRLLNYPLTADHIALRLHHRDATRSHLDALEAAARATAASLHASAILTIATGLNTMSAWIASAAGTSAPERRVDDGVSIGIGGPGAGRAGFISSHREAERALDLVRLAPPGRLGPVARFDDVRLLAILAADVPAARDFVVSTLRDLAVSDAREAELRETLLAFLSSGKSYTAVATTAHLHKNTVAQRVKRAGQLIGENREFGLDVSVALMLADVLGDQVLARPGDDMPAGRRSAGSPHPPELPD